jgi:hypothetical protein
MNGFLNFYFAAFIGVFTNNDENCINIFNPYVFIITISCYNHNKIQFFPYF